MCPNLGTVLGYVKRHITHNFNTALVCISLQLFPLTEKLILRKLPEQHLIRVCRKELVKRFWVACAILFFPSGKCTPTVCLLNCHECGKIRILSLVQKGLKSRRFAIKTRKRNFEQRYTAIEQCLIVNAYDTITERSTGIFLGFLLSQQSLLNQVVYINKVGTSCNGTRGCIR